VSKKRVVWLLMALFGAVALFSIGALADEAQPQYGGHLIWAEPYSPQTLDPHNYTGQGCWNIVYQVYDQLVDTDPGQNPIPRLAVSWEQTDPNTWIFHLRDGVHWQDGNELWADGQAPEVTAQDVVYSYERVLNPDNALARRALIASVDKVEALDKYTVKIHLSEPDAFFLSSGVSSIFIVPKELVDKGLIAKHPIGSGPFEFISYTPGERVVFKKNKDYWMPVYLDGMTMRIIPDKQVAVMALEAGDVDLVTQINPSSVPRLKREGFQLIPAQLGAYRYLAFNTKNPPWDNVKMREAIAHAINRDQLIKVIFPAPGLAEPAYQHESPSFASYDPAMKHLPIWTYDLEKAKALLEEEGWIDTDGDGIRDKNGKKLALEILTPSADPNRKKIGVILATELKKELGIDATTRALEWGTYLDRIQVLPPKNDVQAYIIGGYSGLKGLYYLFSSSTWGPGGNSCFYSNPNVDELFKLALASTDPNERVTLWREAQILIYQDIPHIPLYFEYAMGGAKPTVHGYVPWAMFNTTYNQVWMEKK